MTSQPHPPEPGSAAAAAGATPAAPEPSTADLITQLQADRLWLLRQIDAGAWPAWRLDLAALERELGELLDRVAEVQEPSS
ncbi:hypothetical protein [Cyanobium sp. NIES-981]|uniref:hypothetical protein n=1 Tax=Cyanobium sp. NIES-981 TaxID=1851505 RepID=UPI0007DD55C0|nr:hypothetical protein [Cyanobium sp. NIES-981]SBO42514.1 conserved protein of unknown function [Cyanobium sp. NIES-981]